MAYHSTIRGQRFNFADLRQLLAKANEEKSGDAPTRWPVSEPKRSSNGWQPSEHWPTWL